jgi:membrane-bound lytic murein transglycosylase B
VDRWLASRSATPTPEVTLGAFYQQRVYRLLSPRPKLARAVIAALPARLRNGARDSVGALRSLFRLTSFATEQRFRFGPATRPHALRSFYGAAQRRFRVGWEVLAAINFIESNFGRLRNVSNAGAVGPMQFIPSTWAAYGMGGNIGDPRDAILGAANYLRASGAPANYARAVFAYNRSPLYVDAVLRYARRMRRDPRAFWEYWSWQSFMRTRHGDRQLTGPK